MGARRSKAGLWSIMAPVRGRICLAMTLGAVGTLSLMGSLMLISASLQSPVDESYGGYWSEDGWFGGWLVVILVLAAVSVLAKYLSFFISHLGAFDLELKLRTRLAEHLAKIPLGRVIGLGSGSLKKILMDDVKCLHAFVADSTPFIGRTAVGPLVSLAYLFGVDTVTAMAATLVFAIGLIVMTMVFRGVGQCRHDYDLTQEALNEAIIEYVQAMPVIRVFDDGAGTFNRFNRALANYRKALTKWIARTGISARLGLLILSPMPTLIAVALVGGVRYLDGRLAFPELVGSLVLCGGLADCLVPIMWLSSFINKSQAAALRISELESIEVLEETLRPAEPKGSEVVFDSVSFRYEGHRQWALKELSFIAQASRVTALVGSSGAGKSTVARLIARFWDAESGRILVGGTDVRDLSYERLTSTVGLVFQETFLFHSTIAENLRLAKPDASESELEEACRKANIHDFIASLPEGYYTRAADRGVRFSGGQRQRITIARAFLRDCPVLILDEATAFSDPETEDEVLDAVSSLVRGRTVIIIAHRLRLVRSAHLILFLEDGRLSECGNHESLMELNGRYRQLFESQEKALAWTIKGDG